MELKRRINDIFSPTYIVMIIGKTNIEAGLDGFQQVDRGSQLPALLPSQPPPLRHLNHLVQLLFLDHFVADLKSRGAMGRNGQNE